MKRLLEEAEKNQELKEKIVELDKNPESTLKDYIKVAAEYGIELKEEDFKPAQAEITDDELDAVAGGGDCACVIGGGGTSSQLGDTCVCAVAGGGEYSSQAIENGARCVCAFAGGGTDNGRYDCRRSGF